MNKYSYQHSLLFIFVFLSCSFLQAQEIDVRVRILKSQYPIVIQGEILKIDSKNQFYKRASFQNSREDQIIIHNFKNGIWSYSLNHSEMQKLKSPIFYLEGLKLSTNKQESINLPNKIFIWPHKKNNFDLIAILQLNDYLAGVIPSEMPLSWPKEALKAQTILARTFALYQIQNRRQKHFHLDSSVLDQKYEYKKLSLSSVSKVKDLIKNTDHYVLKQNSKIIKAHYHADCGGQILSEDQVWSNSKNLNFKACVDHKVLNWSFLLPQKVALQKLDLADSIQNIKLHKLPHHQRVHTISFKTPKDSLDFSSQKIREKLGFQNLKSTAFQVEFFKDQVLFKGIGYGHGVGLCQNGAKKLAEMNKNYKEILKFYFPNYKLETL